MKTFKDLLIELKACRGAQAWAADMAIEQVVATCERGDWLGWLANKIQLDKRKRCLVAGHIANQVRHLMQDEKSKTAVDVAIAYGEGKATDEELEAAWSAARDAAWSAAMAAAADIAAAAWSAAWDAAWYESSLASLKSSADIIRKHIGQDIINRVNEILSVNP